MAVTQSLSVTEVSGSVSYPDNSSQVKIVWKSTQSGESWNGYTRTARYYISINGGAETEYTVEYTLPQNSTVTLVSKTITVKHKSDGTGTVKVRTWMDTGISAGVVEQTKTIDLTNIPRASAISEAKDTTLGNACSIKFLCYSKSYSFYIKFSMDSWSYTTDVFSPKRELSTYTYSGYKIPLDAANQIQNDTTGTMTATLYTCTVTVNGNVNQVGSPSSKTFTVTVPDNASTKPSVTMALTPVSSLGSKFSGLYIQGLSKVKATFKGEGEYGAKISSYSMSILGKSYGSPYESGYLSESATVTGKATDSRGYSREVEQDVTVIPYSKPQVLPASGESGIICARCDAEGNLTESGTYLKIKAKRSYSTVKADGVQKNFCTIRYRCVSEGTKFSGDEGWVTLLAGSTTTTNTVNKTLSGVVSSTETAYVVQVGVIDDIGYSSAVQFFIPTDFVTIDIPAELKGRRIGIGRYAEDDAEEGIDVGMPIHGGGVDNLTLGERITATETAPIDLNTFTAPGNYYSANGDNSKYITNTPYTGGGFGLVVRHIQSKNMIRQEMFFGRTNWCRHLSSDTGEWSNWLRSLMTSELESSVADFVIESGESEGWTYKKWKSGTYEMFGYFEVQPSECTQQEGRLVYRTNSIGIKAPFKIASACASGTVQGYCWLSNSGISEDHEYVAIRLLSTETISTSASFNVRLAVMGKYE